MPRVFMLAFAVMAVAGSMLPIFRPPTINASFETLTVQDHPVNAGTLVNEYLLAGAPPSMCCDLYRFFGGKHHESGGLLGGFFGSDCESDRPRRLCASW
jgi:hypothetical protein